MSTVWRCQVIAILFNYLATISKLEKTELLDNIKKTMETQSIKL